MTEERLESESESGGSLTAVDLLQIMITLDPPQNSNALAQWDLFLNLIYPRLEAIIAGDKTGKVIGQCLNVLYDSISDESVRVNPAAWKVLDFVEEGKVAEIVGTILNNRSTNSNDKVTNALISIIQGMCQCGSKSPRLKDWTMAIVSELEARKNYSVLIAVSEKVMAKLLNVLPVPLYLPEIYPIFKQFLYPVVEPQVFHKILEKMPRLVQQMTSLQSPTADACLRDFTGMLKALMIRFPATPVVETKYTAIRLALLDCQVESTFEPDRMVLWDVEQDTGCCDWLSAPQMTLEVPPIPATPYKGLMNQGNTCFMNSVLQVLYMTTRFRTEMLSRQVDDSEKVAKDIQHLLALMQESVRSVVAPGVITESTLPTAFSRGHQQDSAEYLIHLLDTLHENESKLLRRQKLQRDWTAATSSKKEQGSPEACEGAAATAGAEWEETLVDRLFGGEVLSTTECSSCKGTFPNSARFRDLPLALPDHEEVCDLQQLVDMSLQPEFLTTDNMYNCAKCGGKRDAVRRHSVVKAPQHLILTLKLFRFDPVRKQRLKLHSRLKNSQILDLSVHDSSHNQVDVVRYELKAVVLHSGSSLDGGHYFAWASDPHSQWFIFNDSVVSAAQREWSSASGGGGTPYILLLRQQHICDPPAAPLPSNLQLLVNRDNAKYRAERPSSQRATRGRDYDDDVDDMPPSGGSLGGPRLVF